MKKKDFYYALSFIMKSTWYIVRLILINLVLLLIT